MPLRNNPHLQARNTATMFLENFYSLQNGQIVITADQASRFAKDIAGDYNPIHNPDARRFVVPGDLLFSLVLDQFGLYQRMSFHFRALLGDQIPLTFAMHEGIVTVTDTNGKVYLEASCEGNSTRDKAIVEQVSRCYVAASGTNFPHALKPLMAGQGVMFNPQRPMVIYESMSLDLDSLPTTEPQLKPKRSELDVAGKRGTATLEYTLSSGDQPLGNMAKTLVITGLREYDENAMNDIVTQFYQLKENYRNAVDA